MLETILFFIHSSLLLLFGVFLSSAFTGIQFTRKNIIIQFVLCLISGCFQLVIYILFKEAAVRKLYPLIAHLPIFLLLHFVYKKKLFTALIGITTAYLCCQPAKWLGMIFFSLTNNPSIEYISSICVLMLVGYLVLTRLTPYMSETFLANTKSIRFLGMVPFVYYIFDYLTGVYTDLGLRDSHIVMEFMSFFLSIVFFVFCTVYHKESSEKAELEQKEQFFRMVAEQQEKEIDSVKRNEQKLHILRHDMRLYLNNISMCIENNDLETVRKLISGYISAVESTALHKYCSNTTMNYILSNFAARCEELHTEFLYQVELGVLTCDEVMLSTIISNALDNALNAQKNLPEKDRKVKVLLKTYNGKTLFSVTNSCMNTPILVDGMPVASKPGHGYGSLSIVLFAESMGGTCQFMTEGKNFIVRVMIP